MSANKPTVMLLSKSESLAAVDKRALREIGATTMWSMSSGVDAARLLADLASAKTAVTPDIVICHQELEDMDGEQFCSMLRLHPRLISLPVLLILGNDGEVQQLAALGCGASAMMARPYSQSDLKKQLDMLRVMRQSEAQLRKGASEATTQSFDAALASYALLLKPVRQPEDYFQAAMRCLEVGQWNSSIALFQRALRGEHLKGEAELGIAAAYKGKGDIPRYKAWLARAAESFARARRWHRARAVYARLTAEHGHVRNPVLAAAQRLLREGDFEGAATALAATYDLTPRAVIADKVAQSCLVSSIEANDSASVADVCREGGELIAGLEAHLEGKIGNEAHALGREIHTQLEVLAVQREERLQQQAEERRREMAAFNAWETRQSQQEVSASGKNTPEPVQMMRSAPASVASSESSPSSVRELDDFPSRDDVLPLLSGEPSSSVFDRIPFVRDVVHVMKCTWKLSRRSKE